MTELAKQFCDGKFVVNCRTEDEVFIFIDWLKCNGIPPVWTTNVSLEERTMFNVYGSITCYHYNRFPIQHHVSYHRVNGMSYGTVKFYREEYGFEVMSLNELLTEYDSDDFDMSSGILDMLGGII